MRELLDDLKNIRLAIFDLDGVVYRGNTLIPNADKVINELKDLSIKVVYNSNNSTATRKTYVKRLKNLNIESKISDLVSNLPRFYSNREKINIKSKDIKLIIELVKKELSEEGEEVNQIDLDLRFGKGKEWFVLIHPSNTEPIIRVISEAKRESLARVYCEATAELIRLIISRM